MTLQEAKDVIYKDQVCMAFVFYTVYGVPLEVFNDWTKNLSLLEIACKCAYWRERMPQYFEPILWKN